MKIDGGLRILFRKHLPDGMWQTIETGSTSQGVPDSYYAFTYRKTGWIEYKNATANAVRISPFQIAWHARHWRLGGVSFFAVRRDQELFLFTGEQGESLKVKGLRTAPLIWADGGPSRWPWERIKALITG